MTEPIAREDELLFAFLDGELDDQQLERLHTRLQADTNLQRRLDALKTIHAGLVHIASLNDHPIGDQSKPRRVMHPTNHRWYLYAAMLALAGVLLVSTKPWISNRKFDAGISYIKITRDFEPQIVCDTPESFERYTRESFGQPINARFDTGLEYVGWRYLGPHYNPSKPPEEPVTRVLLVETPEDTRVLVYFVPKGLDTPALEPGSDLQIFRKVIRSVRMYEVTPLQAPSVINQFQEPKP